MMLDCPKCYEKNTVVLVTEGNEQNPRYHAVCVECQLRTKDFPSMKTLLGYWFQRDAEAQE